MVGQSDDGKKGAAIIEERGWVRGVVDTRKGKEERKKNKMFLLVDYNNMAKK